MLRSLRFLALVMILSLLAGPVLALDDAHAKRAEQAFAQGIEFLRKSQNADGSWTPQAGPAITALVVSAMLDRGIAADDPALAKGLSYILTKVKPDGGIHDGTLENYNTSICLSALARVKDRPGIADVMKNATDYLRKLQWSDQKDPQGAAITAEHAFYGGAGYGKDGRPDLSNTTMMIQGLYDAGVDCEDPAFTRAMVFITRCQGTAANKDFGDKIVPDGGFVYSTSLNKEKIGQPESKAGEYKMEDGTTRLATYGSMTYAGFKSYLYAELDRKDPRVVDAYNWIRAHYTIEQNPGLPEAQKLQGYYYYCMTFARALRAWGEPTITTTDGKTHDWSNDLVEALASRQQSDGSWTNPADRWMEGDANLVTAYSLLALHAAIR